MPAGRGGVEVDWGIGDDGRTGGLAFFRLTLRPRARINMTKETIAVTARMIYRSLIGIRWRASLGPNPVIHKLRKLLRPAPGLTGNRVILKYGSRPSSVKFESIEFAKSDAWDV